MRSLMVLEFLFLAAAVPPEPSPIRLPAVHNAAPMPADAAVVLTSDVVYVWDSDVPVFTRLLPGGAVAMTPLEGPMTIRDKFYGGNGQKESKHFKGKFIYLVEAVKEGRDTLVIIPAGLTKDGDIKSVTFQVGTAPRPPPDEKKDETKPVAKDVWLVLVEESGQRTAAMANVVNGLLVNGSRLTSAGIYYRTYDQDSDLGKHYKATAEGKGVKLPAAIVIDRKAKDGAEPLGVFPVTTFAELESKAKSFTGGK